MFMPGLGAWFSHTVSVRYPEKRALRMLMLSWATATALLLMVSQGETGQGQICYSTPTLFSQATPLMNTTAFTCPTLGAVTIPQIYQLGWRVTQLSNQVVMNDPNPQNIQVAWMILIENP